MLHKAQHLILQPFNFLKKSKDTDYKYIKIKFLEIAIQYCIILAAYDLICSFLSECQVSSHTKTIKTLHN